MNTELLLSDKFVEFSQNIAVLHESKKKLQIEIKKLLEEHKSNIKKIEDEAALLTVDFDTWQKENTKK